MCVCVCSHVMQSNSCSPDVLNAPLKREKRTNERESQPHRGMDEAQGMFTVVIYLFVSHIRSSFIQDTCTVCGC